MAKKPAAGRVLLLGGSGFVGRALVRHLARRDFHVRVPTRHFARSRPLLVFPEVELLGADVHDEAVLARLARGCDIAINLVGVLHANGASGFERAHAELPAKLIRACKAAGVPRLLHMSALGADAAHGPSNYLRSKGRGEETVVRECAGDIAWTVFRPSLIFGHDDSSTQRFARLLRRLPVLPLARPDARFAPVYVEDVARAFTAALDAGHGGKTYELCGPEVYTLRELVEYVRGVLGLRRAIVGLPDALGKAQALVGELLPGKPFTRDNFASLAVPSVCSSDGLGALGIEPRRLRSVAPGYLRGRDPRRLARLGQDRRGG